MADREELAFSFAGLKTAVALAVDRLEAEHGTPLPPRLVADVAASFQEAAIDAILAKLEQALARTGLRRVAVVGGLAANRRLRERLAALEGVAVHLPPPALCTDNAAMIAAVGDRLLREGRVADLDLDAFSRAPLPRNGSAGHP